MRGSVCTQEFNCLFSSINCLKINFFHSNAVFQLFHNFYKFHQPTIFLGKGTHFVTHIINMVWPHRFQWGKCKWLYYDYLGFVDTVLGYCRSLNYRYWQIIAWEACAWHSCNCTSCGRNAYLDVLSTTVKYTYAQWKLWGTWDNFAVTFIFKNRPMLTLYIRPHKTQAGLDLLYNVPKW